jgi:hypothetical protein
MKPPCILPEKLPMAPGFPKAPKNAQKIPTEDDKHVTKAA